MCRAACQAQSYCQSAKGIWADVKKHLLEDIKSFKMGSPEDMSNFITAVIHEGSFDKLAKFIDAAKSDGDAEIINR